MIVTLPCNFPPKWRKNGAEQKEKPEIFNHETEIKSGKELKNWWESDLVACQR